MDTPLPFVCVVDALDAGERDRQRDLVQILTGAKLGVGELEEGFAFYLKADADTFAAAAEWMERETRCCPFLFFALEWRNESEIVMRIAGPPGAKAFIAETFADLR